MEMVPRQDNPESHEWIIIMTSPVAPSASGHQVTKDCHEKPLNTIYVKTVSSHSCISFVMSQLHQSCHIPRVND